MENKPDIFWDFPDEFQSLIGTVQQQCLLRFMFSLYLISTVFQSFSPKKAVNLFIENSRKALILLAWRFTDFFYRFFNNLCFNQRKSSSPLTKTEASFEYLNHTRNPAFAVHPCPSPIFCHQEDKSELRGATPHFLPRLTPKPAQEWLPANFTVHSDFSTTISAIRLLSPATSVIGRFLHRQSRVHYWLYLCHTSCHTDTP